MADEVVTIESSSCRIFLTEHNFYVGELKNRVLSQLSDAKIDAEVDKSVQEEFSNLVDGLDPEDYNNLKWAFEAADHEGDWLHGKLLGLRQSLRLSIISAFFHMWEKNIRQWLISEFENQRRYASKKELIWKAGHRDICELLRLFEWDIGGADFSRILHACRLVVNVYKHGDGHSFKELSEHFSKYIGDWREELLFVDEGVTTLPDGSPFEGRQPYQASHTDIKIEDAHLNEFSDAVVGFWSAVPQTLTCDAEELTAWFDRIAARK